MNTTINKNIDKENGNKNCVEITLYGWNDEMIPPHWEVSIIENVDVMDDKAVDDIIELLIDHYQGYKNLGQIMTVEVNNQHFPVFIAKPMVGTDVAVSICHKEDNWYDEEDTFVIKRELADEATVRKLVEDRVAQPLDVRVVEVREIVE